MRTFRSASLRMLAAVLLSAVLTVPLAVPARAAAAPAPTDVWSIISVTVRDLAPDKTPTLVITAQARPELGPPLEVAIAIPKGVEISWVGEVLGGDPANDPTLEIRVEEAADYDLVYFTLTQAPLAQLELTVPEAMMDRTDERTAIDLAWTAAGPADKTRMGIVVPADMHLEDGKPALTVEAQVGRGLLYSVETSPVAAAQTLTIAGTVLPGLAPEMEDAMAAMGSQSPDAEASGQATESGTLAEEPSAGSDGTGGGSGLLLLLGGLAAAAAIAAAVLARRAKTGSSAG